MSTELVPTPPHPPTHHYLTLPHHLDFTHLTFLRVMGPEIGPTPVPFQIKMST